MLDVRDGLFARQDAGDAEEAGLHDGVDAPAHPDLLRQRISVDDEEADSLLYHLLLHLARQAIPSRVGIARSVQEKDRARCRVFQHVDLVYELKLMTGDEGRPFDKISGADGPRARAQVRDREGAGLLRVVNKIALHKTLGLLTDDFDGVLVGPDRPVRAETVKQGRGHVVALCAEGGVPDRKSTRLKSSHTDISRMPSSSCKK